MTLEFAILGFLNYQPLTGYDLKKVFDRSIRHFWHADQSQIYRTLSRLTEEKLVEVEIQEQMERPDRKVYSITPAGREKLRDWLASPFPMGESHSTPLVQVFFSGEVPDETVIAKLTQTIQGMKEQMAEYEKIPALVRDFTPMAKSKRDLFYWFLTLEYGKRNWRMNIDWMESVIQRIQKQDYSTDTGFE